MTFSVSKKFNAWAADLRDTQYTLFWSDTSGGSLIPWKVSGKCFVISSCICFIVISAILSVFCLPWFIGLRGNPYDSAKTLTPGVAFLWIELEQVEMYLSSTFSNELKSPTFESFIRETTKGN